MAPGVRRFARHLWLVALVAAIFMVLPAGVADAGCGGVRYMRAKKKPKHGRAPFAIGDSTMLLAMDNLAKIGYDVNAHGCRGMEEGIALLKRRRAKKALPHFVVIALGADFSIKRNQIKRALRILGPGRVLGLVTPWELGGHAGKDAKVVRAAGKEFKKRVKVLDWVKYSRGHRRWFQPDRVHLTHAGARAFAKLFKKALRYAQPPPPPPPPPEEQPPPA
jgi:hypothetical protein